MVLYVRIRFDGGRGAVLDGRSPARHQRSLPCGENQIKTFLAMKFTTQFFNITSKEDDM